MAALASPKKKNKVSERECVRRGGEVAPLLLISANGFCRARRELYALIMQGAGVGAAMRMAEIGESTREWVGRGKESGVSLSARFNSIVIMARHL